MLAHVTRFLSFDWLGNRILSQLTLASAFLLFLTHLQSCCCFVFDQEKALIELSALSVEAVCVCELCWVQSRFSVWLVAAVNSRQWEDRLVPHQFHNQTTNCQKTIFVLHKMEPLPVEHVPGKVPCFFLFCCFFLGDKIFQHAFTFHLMVPL